MDLAAANKVSSIFYFSLLVFIGVCDLFALEVVLGGFTHVLNFSKGLDFFFSGAKRWNSSAPAIGSRSHIHKVNTVS